jgi:hypothetical protein
MIALLAMGGSPGAAVNSAAERAGDGGSLLWPLFLLGVVAYIGYRIWKFSRVVREQELPKRLAKNWEDQFWLDFDRWREDPLNRV